MAPLPLFSTTRSATTPAPRIASSSNSAAIGHLRRRRSPGQVRRAPEVKGNGRGGIRVAQRWVGSCGMLRPPAPVNADHGGMAAECGLVPAWGETDAEANRYHEPASPSNPATAAER